MGPLGPISLHLQRTEEIATLRESMLRLWSEEGPWPLTLGSKRVFMSLVRQRFFIKDVALDAMVSVNSWGVYQACLLYTSDAADDHTRVDFGGPRINDKNTSL